MTVLDLLRESSIMIGSLAAGEDLGPAESEYALSKLNQMVDMWAADRLAIHRRQRVGPFAITANTQSYTIGPSGTWDTARPVWIDGAGIIQTPSASQPVEVPMNVFTQDEYKRVGVKNTPSALPRDIYYDREFTTAGLGTIILIQKPTTSTPQIVLYVPVAVTEFSDLVTTIALPPGYRMAMVSNLAILLAMGIRAVPVEVGILATTSFANLKSGNVVTQMDALKCDPALSPNGGAGFDWLTGNFS